MPFRTVWLEPYPYDNQENDMVVFEEGEDDASLLYVDAVHGEQGHCWH